jgi:hypothetical protein
MVPGKNIPMIHAVIERLLEDRIPIKEETFRDLLRFFFQPKWKHNRFPDLERRHLNTNGSREVSY